MDDGSVTVAGARGDAPDIIADTDLFGAKLVIAVGADRTEARPTPEGAMLLGMWLIAWAISAGAAMP